MQLWNVVPNISVSVSYTNQYTEHIQFNIQIIYRSRYGLYTNQYTDHIQMKYRTYTDQYTHHIQINLSVSEWIDYGATGKNELKG